MIWLLNLIFKCHQFKMEQYIPYSLICDFFSRNLETYSHNLNEPANAIQSHLENRATQNIYCIHREKTIDSRPKNSTLNTEKKLLKNSCVFFNMFKYLLNLYYCKFSN